MSLFLLTQTSPVHIHFIQSGQRKDCLGKTNKTQLQGSLPSSSLSQNMPSLFSNKCKLKREMKSEKVKANSVNLRSANEFVWVPKRGSWLPATPFVWSRPTIRIERNVGLIFHSDTSELERWCRRDGRGWDDSNPLDCYNYQSTWRNDVMPRRLSHILDDLFWDTSLLTHLTIFGTPSQIAK